MKVNVVTLYSTPSGWRWHNKDLNGNILGASTQAYTRRIGALANLNRSMNERFRVSGRKYRYEWRVKA